MATNALEGNERPTEQEGKHADSDRWRGFEARGGKFDIPIWFSLLLIGSTIAVATIASLIKTSR